MDAFAAVLLGIAVGILVAACRCFARLVAPTLKYLIDGRAGRREG